MSIEVNNQDLFDQNGRRIPLMKIHCHIIK